MKEKLSKGVGGPRKQYLILSWVDGAFLRALELLQTWWKEMASKGSVT